FFRMHNSIPFSIFFFFNDPTPSAIYTLSLHDALPIYFRELCLPEIRSSPRVELSLLTVLCLTSNRAPARATSASDNFGIPRNNRSEEHTSELQSPCNLVCRLLLEKKNQTTQPILNTAI